MVNLLLLSRCTNIFFVLLGSKSGVHMQDLDSNKVILAVMQLDESDFESFQCERQINLGIDLDEMKRLLGLFESKDKLTMIANEDCNVVTLMTDGVEFSSKLVIIQDEMLEIPVSHNVYIHRAS